jgi:hypothetical protein
MKLHEYEPHGSAIDVPLAIRNDDSSVLTCATCGCRLTARVSVADGGRHGADAAWRHFPGIGQRDARGCLVECMDEPHRMASVGA